ncbi:MAG TPA: VCBS repeat-containing protein, partial [Terracidiphilus sp.]|nr:VCBS repeat-containing protein [Terracidiphilus sp.]
MQSDGFSRRSALKTLLGAAAFGTAASRAWPEPAHAAAKPSAIRFEEMAQRAGLDFVTRNCATPNKNQIETMVCGVALFDYDGDGLLDLYLVNGAEIPSLEKVSPAYWNRLYHNNGNGTFTDVTEKAGVAGKGYGMGVVVGDYNNDGHPD